MDVTAGYLVKIMPGNEKLRPEAQARRLLSECNTGIACKQHTLGSGKPYMESAHLLPWS